MLADPVTMACRPPDQVFQGSMVYWYNSTSYRDDLAWAASWMFKATGDQARPHPTLTHPALPQDEEASQWGCGPAHAGSRS